jgi:hypothetical protein
MNTQQNFAVSNTTKVADFERRLRNARRRATYWSGNPSSNGRGFCGNTGEAEWGYNLALSDIRSLCDVLDQLTGNRPKRTDPKAEFRARIFKSSAAVTAPAEKS